MLVDIGMKKMIDVLLGFVKDAGSKLELIRSDIFPITNKDNSIESMVTQADIDVSNMFEETIKENFAELNYMIIDEEKISRYGDDVFDVINDTEYQFVIDPIDGTLLYANNHPLYGISIGVYKNTKPLLGIIYLSEINELTYYDGNKAYWVHNAFDKGEIISELLPNNRPSSSIIFGHSWLWNLTEKFSTEKALFLDYFSAVSQSFYPLIGKAKAYCMFLKLWDIAGTIPLANYLGMKIFEYGTGKVYDSISSEYFDVHMNTKKHCIMCHPEDYDEICSMVQPKI